MNKNKIKKEIKMKLLTKLFLIFSLLFSITGYSQQPDEKLTVVLIQ
jgi:hypothetical protein